MGIPNKVWLRMIMSLQVVVNQNHALGGVWPFDLYCLGA